MPEALHRSGDLQPAVRDTNHQNRCLTNIGASGLDLAKSVFQLHAIDEHGAVIMRKRLTRGQVLPVLEKIPPCLVGMEACGSAHHWAREIQALGHEVRLMPAQYVKPYVKQNKTDAADAEAICEVLSQNFRLAETGLFWTQLWSESRELLEW